jgi:hypothetical protein
MKYTSDKSYRESEAMKSDVKSHMKSDLKNQIV